MSEEKTTDALEALTRAGVEFVVVGGTAAVLLGAPIVTEDLDIVHRRTDANVERLLTFLKHHDGYHRFDLANRRLAPTKEMLLGTGHINLQTDLGKLDLLCELGDGEGYDEILADTILLPPVRVLDLPRLIRVKAAANRPKDRLVLPILIATLDERLRNK